MWGKFLFVFMPDRHGDWSAESTSQEESWNYGKGLLLHRRLYTLLTISEISDDDDDDDMNEIDDDDEDGEIEVVAATEDSEFDERWDALYVLLCFFP